jgi:hypothetical protein
MAYRFDKTRSSHDEYTTWDVINGDGASVATLTREVCTSLIPPAGVTRGDVLWFAEGCGKIDITVDIPTGATFNAAKIATVGALCDEREASFNGSEMAMAIRQRSLYALASDLEYLSSALSNSESVRACGGVAEAIMADARDDDAMSRDLGIRAAALALDILSAVDAAAKDNAALVESVGAI